MNLTELREKFEKVTSNGWLTWEEAVTLMTYAEQTQGDIVEVGSYQGRSATLLASLGRNVYCIDPWDDHFHSDLKGEEIFTRFKMHTEGLPVIPLRMRVEDWTPFPTEFIYLDGDHTAEGTKAQIEKALQCNPKYIAIHDVADRGGGAIVKAVAVGILSKYLTITNTLAVWRKRS